MPCHALRAMLLGAGCCGMSAGRARRGGAADRAARGGCTEARSTESPGPGTRAAVRRFQARRGLAVDGITAGHPVGPGPPGAPRSTAHACCDGGPVGVGRGGAAVPSRVARFSLGNIDGSYGSRTGRRCAASRRAPASPLTGLPGPRLRALRGPIPVADLADHPVRGIGDGSGRAGTASTRASIPSACGHTMSALQDESCGLRGLGFRQRTATWS